MFNEKKLWMGVLLVFVILLMAGVISLGILNSKRGSIHYGRIEPQNEVKRIAGEGGVKRARIYLDSRETFAGYLNLNENLNTIVKEVNECIQGMEEKQYYGFDYGTYENGRKSIFSIDEDQYLNNSSNMPESGEESLYSQDFAAKKQNRVSNKKDNHGCMIAVMEEVIQFDGMSFILTNDFFAYVDSNNYEELNNLFQQAAANKICAMFRFDEELIGKRREGGKEKMVMEPAVVPIYLLVFGDDYDVASFSERLIETLDREKIACKYLIGCKEYPAKYTYVPSVGEYQNIVLYTQEDGNSDLIVRNMEFSNQNQVDGEPLIFVINESQFKGEQPQVRFRGQCPAPTMGILQNLTINEYAIHNKKVYKLVKIDKEHTRLEEMGTEEEEKTANALECMIKPIQGDDGAPWEQWITVGVDSSKLEEDMICAEFDVIIKDASYAPDNWSGRDDLPQIDPRIGASFKNIFDNSFQSFKDNLAGKVVAHYRLIFIK